MRVIDQEELAILLYETHCDIYPKEDREAMGLSEPPGWYEAAEFNREDFRRQAQLILEKARVALK